MLRPMPSDRIDDHPFLVGLCERKIHEQGRGVRIWHERAGQREGYMRAEWQAFALSERLNVRDRLPCRAVAGFASKSGAASAQRIQSTAHATGVTHPNGERSVSAHRVACQPATLGARDRPVFL